jgi:hypothetical protein
MAGVYQELEVCVRTMDDPLLPVGEGSTIDIRRQKKNSGWKPGNMPGGAYGRMAGE